MQGIFNETIECDGRDSFLDEVNAAYSKLRRDPRAWNAEQTERALWDRTLADGLGDEIL
jgi:hypothetical protein